MTSPSASRTGLAPAKWILGLALVAALILAARYFHWQDILRDMLERIRQLGPWGPVVFILLYIVACVLLVPGSLLTLGAGVVFGVVWGSVYVSIAATLGAVCAFLIGRYLARDWLVKKISAYPKFKAIDAAVATEGWKIVGLTRLSPIFPFTLLNYAFGLTRVSFRDYFFASWIGMIPGTVLYVYVGSLAGDLANLGKSGRAHTSAEWALYAVGLASTVSVSVYVTCLARKALAKRVAF